jgi:hypothetical protein
MSDEEIQSNSPFCHSWSLINKTPTVCLGVKCSRFVQIQDEEVKKEAKVDGFCLDQIQFSYIEDIAISLQVIAENLAAQKDEKDYSEIIDESKKERVDGYY